MTTSLILIIAGLLTLRLLAFLSRKFWFWLSLQIFPPPYRETNTNPIVAEEAYFMRRLSREPRSREAFIKKMMKKPGMDRDWVERTLETMIEKRLIVESAPLISSNYFDWPKLLGLTTRGRFHLDLIDQS